MFIECFSGDLIQSSKEHREVSLLLFDRKWRAREGICPRLHSYQLAESGFELRPADSCLPASVEHQRYAKTELDGGTVEPNNGTESQLSILPVALSIGGTSV